MNPREKKYRLIFHNAFSEVKYQTFDDIPDDMRLELEAVDYKTVCHYHVFADLRSNPDLSINRISSKYGMSRRKARTLHSLYRKLKGMGNLEFSK